LNGVAAIETREAVTVSAHYRGKRSTGFTVAAAGVPRLCCFSFSVCSRGPVDSPVGVPRADCDDQSGDFRRPRDADGSTRSQRDALVR
jgi:hypothetical protein